MVGRNVGGHINAARQQFGDLGLYIGDLAHDHLRDLRLALRAAPVVVLVLLEDIFFGGAD